MKRRQVLKNLGWGAGALVATPAVMSLLQSCTNEPIFAPTFVSTGEGHALRRIVDLIIPSDDKVPGAVDMGVHSFIDAYWKQVTPLEGQQMVKLGFKRLNDNFKGMFNKELAEGKAEEFDQMLGKYLKAGKEQETEWNQEMGTFNRAYAKDNTIEPTIEASTYSLLSNLRGMTIWGWKSSEEIGKNVLWYDPVPGQQKGCIPLSEAGNGNAMAL